MRILQQNCQRSALGSIELNNSVTRLADPSYICLVQEPYNPRGKIANIPAEADFVVADCEGPRAAIYASRDLQLTKINSLCNRDLAVATIVTENTRILVGSFYMDILLPVESSAIDAFF